MKEEGGGGSRQLRANSGFHFICFSGRSLEDAARFHFRAGQFAVFFPQDAHCPSQLWKMPSNVKKLIAKVPMPETHQ